MPVISQQTVHCPNCGSEAMRRHFTSKETAYRLCPSQQVIQTECDACDYLMVMCSLNGAVVEAQAPGTAEDSRSNRGDKHRQTPFFLLSSSS